MKKIFCSLVLSMALSASVQAQHSDIQGKQSSLSVEYGAKKPSDEGKVGVDLVYKHIVVGGAYGWSNDKVDEGIFKSKNTQRLDVHIGGNYRYFIGGDMLYVEGRIVVGYLHSMKKQVVGKRHENHLSGFGRIERSEQKSEDIWKTWGDGNFYVGATPRIGVNFNDFSLFAGYRWDFSEFKFDKEHKSDYFTIGLAKIF